MTQDDPDKPTPTHADSPWIAEDSSWREGVSTYTAVFSIEGLPPWEAALNIPPGMHTDTHPLQGFRSTRYGGPHPADFALQRTLMMVLGGVALASGHVELEMKRILLTARAEPSQGFQDVSLTWQDLERELGKVGAEESELADRLAPVLAWSKENNVRERRNTAIHTAWSLYEVGHIEGTRMPHRKEGWTVHDSENDLADTVKLIWEYHNRLQRLVPWPTKVYPPLPANAPQRSLELEVHVDRT